MSYEARVAAAADIYISRTPVHAQDSDGTQLWTRKQIARAFLAGNAAVISDDTPSSPAQISDEHRQTLRKRIGLTEAEFDEMMNSSAAEASPSPLAQMVATSDPIAWAEVYDGKIVTVQLDRSKWHTSPLYLSAPADHVAPHVDRDYPEEFEAWWKTYRHKNRDPADYSVKKQIAFDAFYFGAQGPAPVQNVVGGGLAEALSERQRQKDVEGWSPDHDDEYLESELPRAALCYLVGHRKGWPWASSWWKPTDRRRDLIKAAALIIAEIDRLDRASQKEAL